MGSLFSPNSGSAVQVPCENFPWPAKAAGIHCRYHPGHGPAWMDLAALRHLGPAVDFPSQSARWKPVLVLTAVWSTRNFELWRRFCVTFFVEFAKFPCSTVYGLYSSARVMSHGLKPVRRQHLCFFKCTCLAQIVAWAKLCAHVGICTYIYRTYDWISTSRSPSLSMYSSWGKSSNFSNIVVFFLQLFYWIV